MSLIITSVLVAGGVLLGRWIARGGRDAEDATPPHDAAPSDAHDDGAPPMPGNEGHADDRSKPAGSSKARAIEADPFADMPCTLGDVIMRGGDEAWLAGGLVFVEEHPVSALFVAPDAGTDRAVYVRPRPSGEIFWLSPLPPGEVLVGAEPPTSLEHAAIRYERLRRLPVHVTRAGSGAPDVGDRVIVAEYTSSGFDRMLVVTGAGTARVWVGTVLEEGMYDLLPSGKSTLS